ncbi:Lon protease 1 [Patescibacteria group bacterium]|nr:Lon protease 1 [Patescibacteria group bacterium]
MSDILPLQNTDTQPNVAASSDGDTQAQSATSQPSSNSGYDIDVFDEITVLKNKVEEAKLPQQLKEKAQGMILRLIKMSQKGNFSSEFEPVSEYINWITKIPFGEYTTDNIEIDQVKATLDKFNYGLEPVKSRILEYLAVLKLQNKLPEASDGTTIDVSAEMMRLQGNSSHAPILCFVGIQGVGKTSMAKAIANALDRKFMRISLGGMGNVTEIRGIPRGNMDAEPGQIVKSLIRTGVMNPLILLDEIDKTSAQSGVRTDVMAALLEILDPEQNSTFMDKYLDYPLDLSQCIFICTANNLGGITAALLDRLEVIRFGSYTDSDKVMIAKNYLLPKVREATGLGEDQLSFADDVWPMVIRPLGFDAGVRQLERTLTELARKVALQIVRGTVKSVQITKYNFRQFIPEDIGVYS